MGGAISGDGEVTAETCSRLAVPGAGAETEEGWVGEVEEVGAAEAEQEVPGWAAAVGWEEGWARVAAGAG